jgi:hypothetical protein
MLRMLKQSNIVELKEAFKRKNKLVRVQRWSQHSAVLCMHVRRAWGPAVLRLAQQQLLCNVWLPMPAYQLHFCAFVDRAAQLQSIPATAAPCPLQAACTT